VSQCTSTTAHWQEDGRPPARNVRIRSSMKLVMATVRRQCLVCEAETIVSEREDTEAIGPPCAECHAPTERLEILTRRLQTAAANPHAAALGRLGGLKGGPARAASLSRERRQEIARQAARRRWARSR
jgi:hypothetical protein